MFDAKILAFLAAMAAGCLPASDTLRLKAGCDTTLPVAPFESAPDQAVEFRLRSTASGGGFLLWRDVKAKTPKALKFIVRGGGEWHEYRLRPFWCKGNVAKLLFRPPANVPGDAKFEMSSLRIVSSGDGCDIDAKENTGVVFELADADARYLSLQWSCAGEPQRHLMQFGLLPGGRRRTYWFDLSRDPAWKGRITTFSVISPFREHPWFVRPVQVENLRFVKGRPDIPADLAILSARPCSAIPRAGRPLVMEIVVRNVGTRPARNVRFSFSGLPAGVKALDADECSPAGAIPRAEGVDTVNTKGGPDPENERVYRVALSDPGPCSFTAALTIGADGVAPMTVDVPVKVLPSLGLGKCSCVPEPKPVKTGDFEIGAFLFPGWTVHKWSRVYAREPQRKPALGWYDETKPETIDWQIKHLVENGISYVSVDWYWDNGKTRLNHWMTAFKEAKYRRFLKWHVMWANHNKGRHSEADQRACARHWISNYFNMAEYQKRDGKPVVAIWSSWGLERDFAGKGGCARALGIMREEARAAGYPGIHFIVMRFPDGVTAREKMERYRSMGFDETTVYKYCGVEDFRQQLDDDGGIPYKWVADSSERHWQELHAAGVPFVPNLSTAYDDRTWRGANGWFVTGINAKDFKRICESARRFGEKTGVKRMILAPLDEWGEGSIGYPNAEHGFGMLEAVRDVFGEKPASGWPVNFAPEDVGLVCPQKPLERLWRAKPEKECIRSESSGDSGGGLPKSSLRLRQTSSRRNVEVSFLPAARRNHFSSFQPKSLW